MFAVDKDQITPHETGFIQFPFVATYLGLGTLTHGSQHKNFLVTYVIVHSEFPVNKVLLSGSVF